jgi:ubiquinone/menaquinone biosynthesis C-methylase UbiE
LWVQSKCGKNERIVDIGGNDGHTFDGWDRSKVTTVDIDLYDIPNFVRANAESLPFKDKEFDTAILCEILEHVENPIKALQEAKRVANKVIITVPEEHDWSEHLDPMMSIEDKEAKEGRDRYTLAKEGNPKCLEFFKEDNLAHLWHNRHYTKELLEEHLTLAGYENFTIQKLVLGDWVFYGAIEEPRV